MSVHPRMRGIMAALANSTASPQATQVLAELNAAIEAFKVKQNGDMSAVTAAIDDLNGKLAALRIGPAGGGGPQGSRKTAISALGTFARNGDQNALMAGLTPIAGMSTDSDPDGGYLISEETATEIMRTQAEGSAMRRIARVITSRAATYRQPISRGGTQSGWVGEREDRPRLDGSTLAMLEVVSGEIYAQPAATQSMLDDSAFNLGEFIELEIADAFNEQEAAAFITGDGNKKPRGFLSYNIVSTADAALPLGSLQYVPSGVAAALSDGSHNGGDALITLVYTLAARYRRNGTWLMNSLTAGVVRKLKDGEDRYLWQESLSAGEPPLLLGYPVEIDENMSDIGANAYPIAFGDFRRGYIIADRFGVRILRDPYTAKPYVLFYATKRVGGALLDHKAIKVLKIAAT